MVPGMTERERLAVDLRRLEWLSDAVIGPARITYKPGSASISSGDRADLPLGIWRRGLASVLVLGKRVRLTQPRAAKPLSGNAAVSAH